MKLLFAEDDPDVVRGVVTLLERSNYVVDAVDNGRDAYEYLVEGDYDAAILDVMMPDMNGDEVVRRIRKEGCRIPVMLLTAMDEIEDRIDGLDAGADDYLTKPFAGGELLARVRALLRRSQQFTPDILHFRDISLDCTTYRLSCGKKQAALSKKTFQLAEMFLRSPGIILSAEKMMVHIWGWDTEAEINVVWVNISTLRKALSQIGSDVHIRMVRGAGYVME
ncbi:MAG: response regulator transcription factor [Eubacterium sp.]|nr:response regulator transcription factor [Eubacterium sp.]